MVRGHLCHNCINDPHECQLENPPALPAEIFAECPRFFPIKLPWYSNKTICKTCGGSGLVAIWESIMPRCTKCDGAGTITRIKWFFALYDFWVGFYFDRKAGILYICPIPCCVIAINLNKK